MTAGTLETSALRNGHESSSPAGTGTSDYTAALKRAVRHGVFTDGLTPDQHRTAKDFVTSCGRALQTDGDPEAAQVLSTVALFLGNSRGPMGEIAWTAVAALMGAQQRPGVISALCQILRTHGSSSETGNLALLALTDEYKPTPDRQMFARAILSLGRERICEHKGFRDGGSGKVVHRLPIIDALVASPRTGTATAIATVLTEDIGMSHSHLEVIARRFLRARAQDPREEVTQALALIGKKGLTPEVRALAKETLAARDNKASVHQDPEVKISQYIEEALSRARDNLTQGLITIKGLFRFA